VNLTVKAGDDEYKQFTENVGYAVEKNKAFRDRGEAALSRDA